MSGIVETVVEEVVDLSMKTTSGLVMVKDAAVGTLGSMTAASVNGSTSDKGGESGESGHETGELHAASSVAVEAKTNGELAVMLTEIVPDATAKADTTTPIAVSGNLSSAEEQASSPATTSSSEESDTDEPDEELDNIKTQIEKRLPASISDITLADRIQVRHVHLLYNPLSGNKRGEKVMRRAKRKLEEKGLIVTATRLERKGHAEQLCETMDLTGIDVLCAVGGDGTFHECVNGMMKRTHPTFVNEYRGGLKNRRGSLTDASDLKYFRTEDGGASNESSSEPEKIGKSRSKNSAELKEKRDRKKDKEGKGKEREKHDKPKKKDSVYMPKKTSSGRMHVEDLFLGDEDAKSSSQKGMIHSMTASPVAVVDPESDSFHAMMKRRWSTLPGRMRRRPLKEDEIREAAEATEEAGEAEEWEKQPQRDADDRGYESEGEKTQNVEKKIKSGGAKSDDEGTGRPHRIRRLASLPGHTKRKHKRSKRHAIRDTLRRDKGEKGEKGEQSEKVEKGEEHHKGKAHAVADMMRKKKKKSRSHRARHAKHLEEQAARSVSFEHSNSGLSSVGSPALSASVDSSTSSWPNSPNLSSATLSPPPSPPMASPLITTDAIASTGETKDQMKARGATASSNSTSNNNSGEEEVVGPKAPRTPKVVPLALIAAGTGNSFMHEIGCAKMQHAVDHICRGVHYPLDICRLYFGDDTTCYSFNSIHWGLASKVNVTAEKLRWMGNAIRYTTAVFVQMMKGKTTLAKVSLVDENDNVIEYDERFCLAIANNIITASKGMKMAPTAKIDDGLLDLLLITTSSSIELMNIFKKTYEGTHVDLPYVRYIKVKKFSITPYKIREDAGREDKELTEDDIEEIEELLDVDGELKGCTPFTCEVLPRSLRFIL